MGFLDRIIANKVEKFIGWMISNHSSDSHFTQLGFDAARSYAKANGTIVYDGMTDCIGFDKVIRGENHWVSFLQRRGERGTTILLAKQPSSEQLMSAELDRMASIGKVSAEDFETARDAILKMSAEGQALPKPSWVESVSSIEDFYKYVSTEFSKNGVNQAYWHAFIENDETKGMIFGFIAILEARGIWFPEQKEYAVMFVKFMWDHLGNDRQDDINARFPN